MSEYHKTKLNLRKDQKVKKSVRGQIMSEYTKTELNQSINVYSLQQPLVIFQEKKAFIVAAL